MNGGEMREEKERGKGSGAAAKGGVDAGFGQWAGRSRRRLMKIGGVAFSGASRPSRQMPDRWSSMSDIGLAPGALATQDDRSASLTAPNGQAQISFHGIRPARPGDGSARRRLRATDRLTFCCFLVVLHAFGRVTQVDGMGWAASPPMGGSAALYAQAHHARAPVDHAIIS